MSYEPDNLVLAHLREMRKQIEANTEAVQAAMRASHRVLQHMDKLYDEVRDLRHALVDFRAESGKATAAIHADVVALENQNISRHGETLNIRDDLRELREELRELRDRVTGGSPVA